MVHYIKDDGEKVMKDKKVKEIKMESFTLGTIICSCLLYTSDAADD